MYLREEITIEVEAGEIEFNYSLTTEDGEWEILTETITLNGAPHSPSIEEWAIMQEETEEQASIALGEYNEERFYRWDD
jgi:hypothetical protein